MRTLGRRDVVMGAAGIVAVAVFAADRRTTTIEQLPTLDDATSQAIASAREIIWPDTTATRIGGWTPISLRFVAYETNLLVCGAFRNPESSWVAAPNVTVAFDDGRQDGSLVMPSVNDWVGPSGVAYHQVVVGSLRPWEIATFDRFRLSSVEQPIVRATAGIVAAVTIEGDAVRNTTDARIGRVTLASIVRDASGIFAGACLHRSEARSIEAGNAVTIDGLDERCPSTVAGIEAAEALGHGGEVAEEVVVARVEEPAAG